MKSLPITILLTCLHLVVGQSEYEFSTDFLFGVATASYQIEGGWNEDGKGENIWDYMTHIFPVKIKDFSSGDEACDSYHHIDEDVALLNDLDVDFYRFSISWSRILPTGHVNKINRAGVDYYHELIDKLLDNDIIPVVTIYHWDLPQPLQQLGGWMNPLIVDYFVRYADVLFEEYASKVPYWVTINEPAQVCSGYADGMLAPGYTRNGVGSYICGHHLLLAHAKTYHLFKDKYNPTEKEAKIGMTINSRWNEADDPTSEDDVKAADRRMQWTLGWFAHPIFSETGDYPPIMRDRIDEFSKEENFRRSRLPTFDETEVALIKGSADFFGLNHYTSGLCSDLDDISVTRPSNTYDSGVQCRQDASWGDSASEWLKSYPEGIRYLLKYIKDNYDDPDIFILENGFSDSGLFVEDCSRRTYIKEYLRQVLHAIHDDGCSVIGYAVWSLMDNFEWNQGYMEKFGLVTVDRDSEDFTRTPKESFNFYKTIISQRNIEVNGCII